MSTKPSRNTKNRENRKEKQKCWQSFKLNVEEKEILCSLVMEEATNTLIKPDAKILGISGQVFYKIAQPEIRVHSLFH